MFQRKHHYIFIILLCVAIQSASAQFPVIDGIKQRINTGAAAKDKLEAIQELMQYKNSLHGDTIRFYTTLAASLALQLNDKKYLRLVQYYSAAALLAKGNTDSVLYQIDNNTLLKFDKKTDAELYYKVQLLKANALNRMNNRPAALELQLQLLNEAEAENNYYAQAYILNFLGATYLNLNNLTEAKKYWQAGLAVIARHPDAALQEIEAVINSNMILCYGTNTSPSGMDSLYYYINKTIEQSRQRNIWWILATGLSYRGSYYSEKHNYENAEKDFKEGISIRNKIGDPLYMINDRINLAAFYNNTKEYDKAIQTGREILAIEKSSHIFESKSEALRILSNACKAKGDYKGYSDVLERFISDADSSAKLNAAEKIAEVEAKYKVQKTQAEIATQKLALLKKNTLLTALGISILLVIIFFMLRFRNIKRLQKKEIEFLRKEEQLLKEKAVTEAAEKERTRIAADLHDNIGVQASAILYGTELLKQEPENHVVNNLHDTAKEMLLNLRETLWAMKNTDIAAADLWLRVINFCKQMGRHYSHIKINATGTAPADCILASAKALNLMMIIQEAVNNAAKHSGAADITVNSSGNWQIKIEDGGKGFDFEKAIQNKDCNGLGNMAERAKASGINISFDTISNKGTVISLGIAGA